MFNYILNSKAQTTGEHEVHKEICQYRPHPENIIHIGTYNTCHMAINAAKTRFPGVKIDGCYYCCNECHTR